MNVNVTEVLNFQYAKFNGAVGISEDKSRQNFGCRNAARVCESVDPNNVTKYFSGSLLECDLDKAQNLFSYRRDHLKTPSTPVAEEQSFSTEANLAVASNSQVEWASVRDPNMSEIQCLMKYRNYNDPNICHEKWTQLEEGNLLCAVREYKERDWCHIADRVSTFSTRQRTPMQCLQHYQLTFNKGLLSSRDWSIDEDKLLIEAAQLYGINKSWQHIANCLEGRASSQCYERWKRIKTKGTTSGTWSDVEERKLVAAVVAHEKKTTGNASGKSKVQSACWHEIGKFVPHRDEAQCREKWVGVLNPSSVDVSPFTQREDSIITQKAEEFKNKRSPVSWSRIACLLRGRTGSQCLRRWKELTEVGDIKQQKEFARMRRAVTVPRHSRAKCSGTNLEVDDFVPVLSNDD